MSTCLIISAYVILISKHHVLHHELINSSVLRTLSTYRTSYRANQEKILCGTSTVPTYDIVPTQESTHAHKHAKSSNLNSWSTTTREERWTPSRIAETKRRAMHAVSQVTRNGASSGQPSDDDDDDERDGRSPLSRERWTPGRPSDDDDDEREGRSTPSRERWTRGRFVDDDGKTSTAASMKRRRRGGRCLD